MDRAAVRENYDAVRRSMGLWDEDGSLPANAGQPAPARLYTRAEVQAMSEAQQKENIAAIARSMRLWDADGNLPANAGQPAPARLFTRAEVQAMSEAQQKENIAAIARSMRLWDKDGSLPAGLAAANAVDTGLAGADNGGGIHRWQEMEEKGIGGALDGEKGQVLQRTVDERLQSGKSDMLNQWRESKRNSGQSYERQDKTRVYLEPREEFFKRAQKEGKRIELQRGGGYRAFKPAGETQLTPRMQEARALFRQRGKNAIFTDGRVEFNRNGTTELAGEGYSRGTKAIYIDVNTASDPVGVAYHEIYHDDYKSGNAATLSYTNALLKNLDRKNDAYHDMADVINAVQQFTERGIKGEELQARVEGEMAAYLAGYYAQGADVSAFSFFKDEREVLNALRAYYKSAYGALPKGTGTGLQETVENDQYFPLLMEFDGRTEEMKRRLFAKDTMFLPENDIYTPARQELYTLEPADDSFLYNEAELVGGKGKNADVSIEPADMEFGKEASPAEKTFAEGKPKYPGNDPTISPGKDWEWRGPENKGSWYNPKTGESMRPDLDHSAPVGPHWDYKDANGIWYRLNPDNTLVQKK